LLNSTAVLSQLGDRHDLQPYGIFGGQPGALAGRVLHRQGHGELLLAKETRQIKRGDNLCFPSLRRRRPTGCGGHLD
jgi:N-methylhydantoinase B/oxoprolinase/acetone carboxylase alpha subunit